MGLDHLEQELKFRFFAATCGPCHGANILPKRVWNRVSVEIVCITYHARNGGEGLRGWQGISFTRFCNQQSTIPSSIFVSISLFQKNGPYIFVPKFLEMPAHRGV